MNNDKYSHLLTPKNIELSEQIILLKQKHAAFVEAEKKGTLTAEQLAQRDEIIAEIQKLVAIIKAM